MPYYVPGVGYYKNDPGRPDKLWMDKVGAVYWPMDNADFIPSDANGWVMGSGGRFNPYTGERGGRPLGTPPPLPNQGPAWFNGAPGPPNQVPVPPIPVDPIPNHPGSSFGNGNMEHFPVVYPNSNNFGSGSVMNGLLKKPPLPYFGQNAFRHTMPPVPSGHHYPRPPTYGA